ncbi:helix-turn-helix transcriptional regulator [Geodermatophilus sp. CPCC 205761]|uniref:helix-turn-helix transcriptional regulator n=1 Tax=Geodermatophilus sp. CPCC 205761 TaxID=2936597 RepID=UPI003EEF4D09
MRSGRTTGRLAAALAVREAAEAAAAGEPLLDVTRAEAVLAALQSLSTCAAAVERWDPVRSRHETLASSGYVADALAAMESAFHEDPLFPAVRASGRPLRVCDIAPADRRGPMFERVITPLRYVDGVSLCLSAGGRYVGSLHASTASEGVDDEAVGWLRLLRADLASLVDPLGGQVPVVPGDGGVLAWAPADGRLLALTPCAHPSLVAGPLAALLHPSAWPSRLGRHLLVLRGAELTAVEARPAGRWVVVEHRPGEAPAGLSLRELEVLCGLAEGETNRMVARSLGVTERTVATHVEHLLAKLGAGNRAAAAAFAVGAGLVRLPA